MHGLASELVHCEDEHRQAVKYLLGRVVVVDDAIAIRPMAYLTLGFDHRLVDGAVADQFMAHVKRQLENFDGAGV